MDIEEKRPSPEELLDLARREEDIAKQGRLKIFLGMAAGVGKTYAMLEEAHQLKEEGQDPVVGIVLTHGREETAELLKGLKKIPEKRVMYKGKEFLELDLEAVIAMKPDLVVVDELAHTNIPGLRHSKRWQDVMEILENGIDVYTTLNVQHIESLKDIVEGIVGISVRETVPDVIIEKASSIRLVDITPEELLQRLKEGKIYLAEQSKVAVENFFQKDRLTALREISLRYAAEKVHLDLSRLPPITETRIDWKPREKILVAVSPSPHSQKLIRMTRRLSSTLNAPWIALNVESGKYLSDEDMKLLERNLSLARNLGAEVITVNNPSILEGIKLIAREKGITQIIIGRPPRISLIDRYIRPTLIDQLVIECTDVDIHLIRQDRYNVNFRRRYFSFKSLSKLSDYFYAFVSVVVISLISALMLPVLGYKALGFIFFLGILILSLYLKTGPIFFASFLFISIWDFFFLPPIYSFFSYTQEDLVFVLLFLFSAPFVGMLLDMAKKHKEMLLKSQETSEALFEIVKAMASNEDVPSVFEFMKKRLGTLLDGTVDIAVKSPDSGDSFIDTALPLLNTVAEKSAFIWAYSNGKEAGWSTDTLPTCHNLYLPIISQNEPVGILIYRPNQEHPLNQDQKNFLYTVRRQIASYIDRINAELKTKQSEQLAQIEKMHGVLLERYSLLFERPIEKARSAVMALKGKKPTKDPRFAEIEHSLDMVTKTFSNVSAMSQLIEGLIPLVKEEYKVDEIIRECCESVKKNHPETPIELYFDGEMPAINLDSYLIKILIYNLLIFLIESSKPGSKIIVRVMVLENTLEISFQSEENIMGKEQLDMVFDKLYSLSEAELPSAGMGLALAKTIAEIHGGALRAERINSQGVIFTFSIGLEDV